MGSIIQFLVKSTLNMPSTNSSTGCFFWVKILLADSLHGMKIPVVRGVNSLSHHKKKQIENCIRINEIIEVDVATEAYESVSDFSETNSKGLPDHYKAIDLYERSPSLANILPNSEMPNSEISFKNEIVIANCDTKISNDRNKSVVFTGRKVTVKIQDNSPASYRKRTIMKTCIRLDEQ